LNFFSRPAQVSVQAFVFVGEGSGGARALLLAGPRQVCGFDGQGALGSTDDQLSAQAFRGQGALRAGKIAQRPSPLPLGVKSDVDTSGAMSQANVDLARRGYQALAQGHLEDVLAILHPEISVEVNTGRPDLPETRTLHGHAGFLENLTGMTEVFEDILVEPQEFIDLGDQLVVSVHTAGHGRASGIRIENQIVHVWTIRDGKATRFRVYGTRQEALDALGLSEEDIKPRLLES
jgi:uncharacterized protein